MTNLNQLERDWQNYKRKERKPIILGFAAVSILVAISLFFILSPTKKAQPVSKVPQMTQAKSEESNNTLLPVVKEVPSVTKTEETVVPKSTTVTPKTQELIPSFKFMQNIKSERVQTPSYHEVKKVSREPSKRVTETPRVIKEEKQDQSQSLSLSSSSAKDKISALIKRFNNSKNPALGLAIARQYLALRNYQKSYYYAVEVNSIDQNSVDSWLITAKSLYFLNQRDKAKQLLEKYMQRNNSSQVVKLYEAVSQGRLKP